ncbi:Hsp20/alpha crystallin family protein [Bacillus velezensis]|uniref:Hsp20/alpha crystallin family protein n=1 Tax=Bacillus velezensis TaxID=492670 RepID=UPI0029E8233E|nr:Hsp20/alpha crystallin family protein [Bacillus velezensis]MDX7984625.1 Hsp20/alpha crystallin family protein [Bacillus velezensis]
MDQSQNDKLDPQRNEDIISHAMDQFFHSGPFAELMQGFQHLVNSAFTEAQVTIDVREEPTGLAVDISVPETFRDGDMLVETKGCYLHVTIRYDHKQAHSSLVSSSMTRTVVLPYKVSEEDMETSWNEQTLTLFFPKK